jgi:hypothetical protein
MKGALGIPPLTTVLTNPSGSIGACRDAAIERADADAYAYAYADAYAFGETAGTMLMLALPPEEKAEPPATSIATRKRTAANRNFCIIDVETIVCSVLFFSGFVFIVLFCFVLFCLIIFRFGFVWS